MEWVNLESLIVNSRSLEKLKLHGCSSVKEISVASEEITILDLSSTPITSLSSISSLPKLTYLDLRNCGNLVSLPELPSALYVVNAYNCISLETEISQRLVLQHMLQSSIPNVHQHGFKLQKHRLRPKIYCRDYFVLPGDHVMDECVFQTEKSSINIPCWNLKMSHLRGFIYSIILSQASLSHVMLVSVNKDDVPLWYCNDGWDDMDRENPISDHLMFWYHDITKFDRISELHRLFTDIEIKFELLGERKLTKGFGVFPVYATTSGFKLQIS
ncbi:hypothetical protein Fmac_003726 [Flemingia macrophylla]|uniref:Leucine-rich repeat domain, L domain-containing protein n=1 Tax=Flemingia macrophylla TaxID=520843 RepID=A0ABD1N2Y0_9FABA